MNRVEEGVSNFRSFQVDARDFFGRADERAKTEMEFHNKRDQEIKDALAAANENMNREIANAGLKAAQRSVWWTAAAVCATLAGVCVALLAIVATVYLAKHATLEPFELFRHLKESGVYTVSSEQPLAVENSPAYTASMR
jgi:hypothetical protein